MRAAKAATELKKAVAEVEDAARRLTEQLGDFLVSECSAASVEYLLQSALPVLKDSIGALCAAKPAAPGAFLPLHLLEVARVPGMLVAPVREWLETCGETRRCDSALPAPGAELVGKVSKLLGSSRLEDSHGTVDHRMLTRLMSTLDPSWSWKEEDVRKMVERASLSRGSPLDCRAFSEWLFCPLAREPGALGGEEAGAGATAEGAACLAAAAGPADIASGEPATCEAAKLEDALAPALPAGQPSRPRSRPPGRPPKAKAPPPPGRPPPPPGPGRSKSQPAAKAAAKATATVGRGHSQPPAAQGLTFAEHLERRRGNLRSSPTPAADSETANEGRDPEVVVAEERERQGLVAELRRLAARTPLGAVAAAAVATEDAVAGAEAGVPSAARPLLGRGRFASVVRSTVTVGGEGTAASSSSSVPVAAKRFAASARPAGDGGSTAVVVPVSALHSARREVEALQAVAGHPNVVELLGLVLPPPAEESGSSEAEASLASPPLQLLLGPCQGSLFGLLGNALAWEVLGRIGRVSLLLDAARGVGALHSAEFAHLDIKSHNILVDHPAKVGGPLSVRVCDFGSARRVGLGQPPPPPEGTSGWSAPELLEPPPGPHADPRLADSFSFGVVIWEVVAGPGAQHPLCGLAGEEYCKALAEGRRPDFPARGDLPARGAACDDEASLAASCWQFEAAKRPRLPEVVESLGALRRKLSPVFSEAS